jgi:hypothetical protein
MHQRGGFAGLMQQRAKRVGAERVPKTYNLDRPVAQFVEALSAQEERSQSTVVNRIIKEYAALKGMALPGPAPAAGAPAPE